MREVSQKKRVLYNSIANGVYQIVLLVSGLILPRFILFAFGSAYNGLVASMTQFLGITEVLTMGLAGAARVELYDSLAHNDINRTSGIIRAINQYMYKAAGVFFIYMIGLSIIYPTFMKSEFSIPEIISLLLIIGTGNIIAYICGYAYNVLLDADNTVYLFTALRIFLTIANVLISILLIRCGRSLQIVKLASAVIFAIGPLFLFFIVPKAYKLDRQVPLDKSWRKNQKYAATNSIALIIHENTDVVLLTILTSTKLVSVYSVYNLVIKGLKGVLGVFTSSMEPFFGNLWANNKISEMDSALTHYEYFIGFFASISLSGALGLILPFVALYTRGITDTEYIIPIFAFLMVIAEFARCIRIPYTTVVQAAGKYKEIQTGAFMEAGLNITTSIFFTIKFGVVGVVIGRIIANLYRTINYSWYVSRCLLKRSLKSTFLLIGWSLFNIIINSWLFSLICSAIGLELNTWIRWIVGAGILVIIALAEVFMTSSLFYKDDLKWLYQYVKRIKIR